MEVWLILRVISGTAKGHKLKTPKGNSTRPTTDRVKESLFNIIAGLLPGAQVLDLFAGTGNLGIEALSRGAAHAVFADKSTECAGIIRDNLNHTRLNEKASVHVGDAAAILSRLKAEGKKFDIVFLDPPYSRNMAKEALDHLFELDLINEDGIVIAERDKNDQLPENVGHLSLVRTQKYGDTSVSFYRKV